MRGLQRHHYGRFVAEGRSQTQLSRPFLFPFIGMGKGPSGEVRGVLPLRHEAEIAP